MIFTAFERMVALRYLRARRQEGFISVIAAFSLLGIALGVATLIIVMSVMNGFRGELLGRVLGVNGHVNVYAYGGSMGAYDELAQKLRLQPGVMAAMPSVEAQALVTHRGAASGVLVRASRPEDLRARPLVKDSIVSGSLAEFGGGETDGEGIAIGIRMAQRLQLQVGDTLTLVSPRGVQSAFGTIPRTRAYPIAAIFDVGMAEYDNNLIFMPLEAAQAFFGMAGAVSGIEIFVADPTEIRAYTQAIADAVGGRGRVLDWQQVNSGITTALQVERNVMFLILSLIIMVAAFNIISSMIMLVKDKGRDIAILRTMGATRGMIMRIFFLSGASIGVIGTVAGLILGVVFAQNIESIRQSLQALTGTDLFNAEIYFLSQLPAKLDWSEVTQVMLMALGLSFAATIYPSWRAARLDPVEALRYE
ncbi:MAG TPA: lipoprotein-releasing ABC transporter permease subunit [Azospirillaceae bacterium]|nr:lipoprotein-releasing ABC transporter permease subunit [Azospirillaceae bacterium]